MGQRIPVVFHVISQNPNAITDLQIVNALNDLNEAFSHTGAYAGGPGANTGISFCLAQVAPDGGITNGITRTESVLSDFDAEIENLRMKDLVTWDPKKYCNIWLVDSLREEVYPNYSCGVWYRTKEGGYATASSGSLLGDGIVITGFGQLLAHEMGHYLSLLHTFLLVDCTNGDCNVNGDGVCDTPPSSVFGTCLPWENSCNSDTLSGFAVDMPDLNQNFMCYSTCKNMFTEGQAQKMRNFLTLQRSGLLAQNLCDKPCTENMIVSFTRDNWFPTTGATINFSSNSSGGSVYEWMVNGIVVGSNSPTLNYSFPANGYYNVTLKVHNGNPACFASYTDLVKITCGVMSRFYPDKRIIASKAGILQDSIFFKNRSVGATNFQWLMSNSAGMPEQVVSNDNDLNYVFAEPAYYKVKLIASNGTCVDTTLAFEFNVLDPTPDGYLGLYAAKCFDQTKVKLSINICNAGYASIPPGTPISFYDADPNTGIATKLDTSFLMPDSVLGKCCSIGYNLEIDVKRIGLNTIYAVFNDNGNSIPWKLPNTSFVENNYGNNLNSVSGIQFRVSIVPPSASLEPGDSLLLSATSVADTIGSYAWSDAKYLTCTNCATPIFVAETGGDAKKRLIANSVNGCIDSSFTDIKIPTTDDFTIKLNNVGCTPGDSLEADFTICNEFAKGLLPKGLKVSFYNADPSSPTAQLLGPVFEVPANSFSSCATFTHKFAGTSATNIYAVVNDNGTPPHTLPNDTSIKEKDYSNNASSITYLPEKVTIFPADTTVFVNDDLTLTITSPVHDPSSIKWITDPAYTLSCTNCISPVVTVKDSATVKVQMQTMFGCTVSGEAKIRIYPPDFELKIAETKCYSNGKTLVKFSICMNNGYDKIFSGVPVSFYDADPSRGSALLLSNSFKTPAGHVGNCDTFSAVINSPTTGKVFGAVNDKSMGLFPDTAFLEMDLANNISNADAIPFTVTVSPADTQINRDVQIQLSATVSGGTVTSIDWSPTSNLSCINCLDPVAKPPHSQQYIIEVKNELSCIASDTSNIKTINEGVLSIPNAFTPNGDGLNDIFYIISGKDVLQISEFAIYDRYGHKVFGQKNVPANNPSYGWNGTVNGKQGSIGTYVYSIKLQFTDNSTKFFKGTITLIR